MPSPFPGMDPYLEERSLWPDVHQRLITYVAEVLQADIRPKYIARIGERIQLAHTDARFIPDVMLVKPPQNNPVLEKERTERETVVADEPHVSTWLDDARHIPYIEIIYRLTGQVVTLIEILSPANKNGEGRNQYIHKQNQLIQSEGHFVEIDLLSEGRNTVLARNTVFENSDKARYLINVSRATRREHLEIYAVPLYKRLPRIKIPLRAPDPDVVLDLPAVFTRCYDVGGYDLLIDYTQLPDVRLAYWEQAWIAERLKWEQS